MAMAVVPMVRAISTVVQTLLLFSTLYKYIHRQYFLFFFFLFMIIEAECNLYKSQVVL